MISEKVVLSSKAIERKIDVDTIGRVNKNVVADVLHKINMIDPRILDVLDYTDTIYVIRNEKTYHLLMDDVIEKHGLGDLSKKSFYQIYPYDKPKGYAVHGLTFDKKIVINLHQLFQSADEYANYLASDERTKKREHRYFAKDCHYKNFDEIISNKYEAVNFLFWNTLFQQIRIMQQSIQTVDMKEYGYDEAHNASVNDMIGFAKYMYHHIVTTEKAID